VGIYFSPVRTHLLWAGFSSFEQYWRASHCFKFWNIDLQLVDPCSVPECREELGCVGCEDHQYHYFDCVPLWQSIAKVLFGFRNHADIFARLGVLPVSPMQLCGTHLASLCYHNLKQHAQVSLEDLENKASALLRADNAVQRFLRQVAVSRCVDKMH